MRNLLAVVAISILACAPATAQPTGLPKIPADSTDRMLNMRLKSMKWDPIVPPLGKGSPMITILHVDPKTHATQLMIHVPKSFHVAPHWHSANETHTIVKGTFIMESGGMRDTLRAGGFNYTPARMIHQAWTLPGEEALLFITVDGPWDVNFVDQLPGPYVATHARAANRPHAH